MSSAEGSIGPVQTELRRLLEADPKAQSQALAEGLKARGLSMPDTLAWPLFLEARHRETLAQATALLSRALTKVGVAYFQHGQFHDLLPLSAEASSLLSVDPGYSGLHVYTRYDAIFRPGDGTLQFLECNAGDPSAMGWNDVLLEAFLGMPAIQALQRRFPLGYDWLVPSHQRVLFGKYREYCARRGRPPEAPRIAFAVAPESIVHSDHEALVQYYRAAGHDAELADPRDFEDDGTSLSLRGNAVHLVFRDTIDEFLLQPYRAQTGPILDAYRDGRVCILNPFRAVYADFKALFEVLTDPDWARLFDGAEAALLRQAVPWTRVVSQRKTTRDGKPIDLIQHVRAHREQLVLKPNEGYGGYGVAIGFECSEADWDALIQKALERPASYVVQAYVAPAMEEFPDLDEAGLHGFRPKKSILSLWSHDGDFAGAFLRASDANVVNVHQGGGLMPAFFS